MTISGTPSLGRALKIEYTRGPLKLEVLMPSLSERTADTGLLELADDLDQVNCQAT
jgi:hypothetical protein